MLREEIALLMRRWEQVKARPHRACADAGPLTTALRRRRLVRWQDLDAGGGRRRFVFDDGKKSDVTPIRLRMRLRKGPFAGHQLEMGRAPQSGLPGADVARGERY